MKRELCVIKVHASKNIIYPLTCERAKFIRLNVEHI